MFAIITENDESQWDDKTGSTGNNVGIDHTPNFSGCF